MRMKNEEMMEKSFVWFGRVENGRDKIIIYLVERKKKRKSKMI